ncbi:MAG TPA: type II toxin-antitoxin system CcdA family antitoxin [Streptosporangiaceae bacterium]
MTAERAGHGDPAPKPGQRAPGGSRKRPKKTGRKAVLNVTISESLAEEVRMTAALGHTSISSVVEKALAEQIDWELTRQRGLAAMEAYYREHGYPTAEERAQADADVAEEERLIHETQAEMGEEGWKPPAWYVEALWPGWWGGK